MDTYHSFKDCAAFQKFLRSGKYPACHKGGCLDYLKIGGLVYTMHEYDETGQEVTWANKKRNWIIEMTTQDRYGLGYYDAEIQEFEAVGLRKDINYAQ
jgi:hypothetical protein